MLSRKICITCVVALLSCVSIFARQLSPQEAISRVRTDKVQLIHSPKSFSPRNIYKDKSENNCVYLFSGEDGFVLVSADDCAVPLLGFSDEPLPSGVELPAPLQGLVAEYVEQIGMAIRAGVPAYAAPSANPGLPDIPVLLSSRWDQYTPFSDLCPPYNERENCVSGCVATAAAQIMYMHAYPQHGIGEKTYTDIVKGEPVTMTANFGETEYLWDVMLPVYDNTSSDESRKAVARLMADLGVAFDMNYDKDANVSSSTLLLAACGLIDYFGYNKGIVYKRMKYYSVDEWRDMLHKELSSGRPLLYEGRQMMSGHAFVCDGYDGSEDMFHYNWGYSGTGDGYYALTCLDPTLVVGDDTFDCDFTSEQGALFAIERPCPESSYIPNLYVESMLIGARSMVNKGDLLGCRLSRSFTNNSFCCDTPASTPQSFWPGIEFTLTTDGSVINLAAPEAVRLAADDRIKEIAVKFDDRLPEGDYICRPIICADIEGAPDGNWYHVNLIKGKDERIAVHAGKFYATAVSSMSETQLLTVSSVKCETTGKNSKDFILQGKVKGWYEVYDDVIRAIVITPDGRQISVGESEPKHIAKRRTIDVEIYCTSEEDLPEGSYLCLASGSGTIFYEEPLKITTSSAPLLESDPAEAMRLVMKGANLYVYGVCVDEDIEIYTSSGLCALRRQAESNPTIVDCSAFTPGLYIVRCGAASLPFIVN